MGYSRDRAFYGAVTSARLGVFPTSQETGMPRHSLTAFPLTFTQTLRASIFLPLHEKQLILGPLLRLVVSLHLSIFFPEVPTIRPAGTYSIMEKLQELSRQVRATLRSLDRQSREEHRESILKALRELDRETNIMKKKIAADKKLETPSLKGPEAVVKRLEMVINEKVPVLVDLPEAEKADAGTSIVIRDIQDRHRSMEALIRKGLALRSIALLQDRWEQDCGVKLPGEVRPTRLKTLLHPNTNQTGTTTQFLKFHGLHEVKELPEALRRAFKVLWLELIGGLNKDLCGLLFLCPNAMHHTNHEDLPELKKRLENHTTFKQFISKHNGWYESFVEDYQSIATQLHSQFPGPSLMT
jgi:hypothetical protein